MSEGKGGREGFLVERRGIWECLQLFKFGGFDVWCLQFGEEEGEVGGLGGVGEERGGGGRGERGRGGGDGTLEVKGLKLCRSACVRGYRGGGFFVLRDHL